MGPFDRTQPEPGEEPGGSELLDEEIRPVDLARVRTWLRRSGQRFFTGDDGNLGGMWNSSIFTFAVAGGHEVLQVRGQWNRVLSLDRRAEVMAMVNARHARTLWPKCFLLVQDDGTMRFAAEVSTPVRQGLSERQLARAMRTGIGTVLGVFAELGAAYPDPALETPDGSP